MPKRSQKKPTGEASSQSVPGGTSGLSNTSESSTPFANGLSSNVLGALSTKLKKLSEAQLNVLAVELPDAIAKLSLEKRQHIDTLNAQLDKAARLATKKAIKGLGNQIIQLENLEVRVRLRISQDKTQKKMTEF